jgi:chitinase
MSVGGWGNCAGFPGMAASEVYRRRFVTQVVNFCRKHKYDGLDLDWEFVSNDEERRDFSSLVKELSAAFRAKQPPLQLSMAAPAGAYYAQWIPFEELVPYFDYIGVMTYDFHGSWSDHAGHNSPLYPSLGDECGSVDESYIYAHSVRGIPNKKLLLGVPFYGRSFDCGGLMQRFTKCGDYSYADTRKLPAAEWDSCWDGGARVPWLRKKDLSEIICFDDVRSVTQKCRYVKAKKAAGIIIWEISQDYVDGASPLLAAVGREFKN